MRYYFLPILFVLLALPATSFAARLYFVVPQGTVHVGDVVPVDLMLDPEGDDVNALEGTVLVSSSLAIIGIKEEGSVVSLWVEGPGIAAQSSVFSGVIPGGFRGVLSPFWVGGHPGLVYTLLLQATGEGNASATLGPSGRAFRNDGKGTEIPVTASDVVITVEPGKAVQAQPAPDMELPEEFMPEIATSKDVFNGASFVAFAANDIDSGIDHYEVSETWTARPGSFTRAESPYRLKDQSLRSYIHIKAVDHAGNGRIVTLPPAHPTPWYEMPWVLILGAGILVLLGYALYRRRRHA
jgi:hypothetical protein